MPPEIRDSDLFPSAQAELEKEKKLKTDLINLPERKKNHRMSVCEVRGKPRDQRGWERMVSEAHFIFSQLISPNLLGIRSSNYFSFWGAVGERPPVGGSDLNEQPRSPGKWPAVVTGPVSFPGWGGRGRQRSGQNPLPRPVPAPVVL